MKFNHKDKLGNHNIYEKLFAHNLYASIFHLLFFLLVSIVPWKFVAEVWPFSEWVELVCTIHPAILENAKLSGEVDYVSAYLSFLFGLTICSFVGSVFYGRGNFSNRPLHSNIILLLAWFILLPIFYAVPFWLTGITDDGEHLFELSRFKFLLIYYGCWWMLSLGMYIAVTTICSMFKLRMINNE